MIWVFAALVAAPYVFYVLQVGRRRKEYLTFRLRRLGVALVLYFVSVAILAHIGYGPIEAIVFGVICGIAGGYWFIGPPKRSRKIPPHIRRAVIARDLKGSRFDPKIHHIDHIVPYSHDGDHSIENLRVVTRGENLRRGAKKPRLRDLF
jgi:hypothetical protein